MIILDTNVLSESLRPAPEPRVLDWINKQAIETLYLSAITVAELRFGAALLPSGRRKTRLRNSLENKLLPLFSGRVLPFDITVTEAYAEVISQARMAGQSISTADGYIAATAAANGMIIATRDTNPFVAAGLEVVNPWEIM
ncbi:MAG: type II toxin-antitoxin system VapC family toxin [Gammaproteobacteria bacterium]|nr:type II toxin-antitoxin system VapC family toxin [Gammaproteobacteria bacterium]